MNDLTKKAKEIIEKIEYITLATTSGNQPWNSPVYSVHDENFNFYWVSWKENTHSKNIRENPNVFLVIYDSTVPEGTGEGVYIKATAKELDNEEEIRIALDLLYQRKTHKRDWSEFMGDFPRRLYKATSEEVWMNADGEINGNYIDKRIEVKL